ncbi:thiopurine S-methyltransferase [Ixodes scapularis]|uniref:thiopurine S-methyltransferase n=1 Tax=Ixodes scapularis TaxID=6945 RepID=UPI001A9EADDD|nr:thiopurine S-methyltransferase [Ixodes scapularis]
MVGTASKPDVLGRDQWTNLWDTGKALWHLDHVYPLLEKHKDLILAGKQDARVYIPMCGKAPELKWFYSMGHRVVGVEFIESIARGFFLDNGLTFHEAKCPVLDCKIFQSPDKRLQIFVCSVFDFNKSCAGEMDIVWDRGALSSINVELRDRYITVMKSLLSPNFSYGLWLAVYDDDTFTGLLRSMPEALLRNLFAGKGIHLRFIDKEGPTMLGLIKSPVMYYLWHLTEE